MSKIAGIIVAVALCVSSIAAWADNENIVVEIDYGTLRSSRTIEIPQVKDRTVLEALQSVATVQTHPVGEYVMVTSIDGVEGKRGEMAWYYMIDGKSADKIAYSKVADGAKHIKWVYKKDVCSPKVDCLNTAKKEE